MTPAVGEILRRRTGSFGAQPPSTSQPDSRRALPSAESLIAHIRKDDDLPQGWMPLKARKRSADDIIALQKDLLRLRKVNQPSEVPRRRANATSVSLGMRPNSVCWHAMQLSGDQERRVNTMIGENNTSSITFFRKQWGISLGLGRRQFTDLGIKLQAHYHAFFRAPLHIEPENIGHGREGLFQSLGAAVCDIVQDFYSIFVIVLRLAWCFLRTPVYCLLTILLLLQLFAMGYTASTDAFLGVFCRYKLPIVRDRICNDWDQDWLPLNNSNSSTESLNRPLDDLLQSEDRALAYELPFYLDKFQSVVRGYRVSLPQSGYSVEEQENFCSLFSDFIDQAKYLVLVAQEFNIEFDGTINYHVINTNWVVQKLRHDGILAPSHDGILKRAMGWLNSWYLVLYLPRALRPSRTTDLSTDVRSVSLMVDHLSQMRGRLRKVIELIKVLRPAIASLGQSSENIQLRKVRLSASNDEEAFKADGEALRWISEKVWGKSFKSWQLERRTKWVDDMNPNVLEFITKFLSRAETDFGQALAACMHFEGLLLDEEGSARFGPERDDSVMKIAKSLNVGIEGLEAHMGSFRSDQRAFNNRILDKVRTGRVGGQ